MQYAGIVKQSFVDYPGKIAAVLFTRGCNFRCPYCHNAHLLRKKQSPETSSIDIIEILEFLQERKNFLDAVVISGGEPTLHGELMADLQQIKNIAYLLKLDTNGTNPELLAELLKRKILDYVAMDIKAPIDYKKYLSVSGKLSSEDFFNIRTSIHLLKNARIKVEFRTTVVPGLHSTEDIVDIARYIEGAPLYTLQQFNPASTLEPALETLAPYSREEMQAIAEKCSPYVQELRVLNI